MVAHVYYINLDSRPDRNQALQSALGGSDLVHVPTTRVVGVHGRSIPDSTLRDMMTPVAWAELMDLERGSKRRKHHSQLSRGGVGCYLSHMRVWQEVANRRQDNDPRPVLILEDDVGVPPNAAKVMAQPLDTLLRSMHSDQPWVVLWTYIFAGKSCRPASGPDAPLVKLDTPWWFAQAYSLTPATAAWLLATPTFQGRLDMQVDCQLQLVPGLVTWGCARFPLHGDGTTDIQANIVPLAPLYRHTASRPNPSVMVVVIMTVVVIAIGLGLGLGLGLKGRRARTY